MPQLIYNPLLKQGLQQLQDIPEPPEPIAIDDALSLVSTNPVQNKVITATLGDKVPKFYINIEELSLGEIGQYQGIEGGDFTPGFFYQRQQGDNTLIFENQGDIHLQRTQNLRIGNGALYTPLLEGLLDFVNVQIESEQISMAYHLTYNNNKYTLFIFAPQYGIKSDMYVTPQMVGRSAFTGFNAGYLYATAFKNLPEGGTTQLDTCNIISKNGKLYIEDGDTVFKIIDGVASNAWGSSNGYWIAYWYVDNKLVPCHLIASNAYYFIISEDAEQHLRNAIITMVTRYPGDNVTTWNLIDTTTTLYNIKGITTPAFIRVDAQPPTDPSQFATAAQGAKADTALQGINKGTDGNYITTTVTAKDINNEQSVSASLTIQATATADSSHKGVAEASDVKSYIASNTATKAQGTTADSALQQLNKGTDGDYITTTVTPKASNQQSVSSSLTMQAVATADADHKGITEASDVKNYIDTGLKSLSEQVLTENYLAYGVEWSLTTGNPTCTRIGNAALHQSLPIQSAMVGGVLDDAGNFTPFDDIADWTQASQKRDGTDGQVMVYVPSFYIRFITLYDKLQVWVSQYPLTGFIQVGNFYWGAHEATLQRSTLKLSDVVSMDPDYRGGNNNSSWDNTYRSLLGMPATYISLDDFRAYARNRWGNYAGNAHRYDYYKWLVWLWVVEYATLNFQTAFNSALDANGYHQGGMGPGVTTWTDTAWNNYNSHYPLIPCGVTDTLGNGSGVVAHSVKDTDNNVLITFNVPRWRGIENFFGHIWKWTDGVLVDFASVPNHPQIMTSNNAADFGDMTKYVNIGEQATAQNYITKITYGEAGDITAKEVGGSSTSYYCDYFWFNNDFTQNTRGLLFGGRAHGGANAGAFSSSSDRVPASVNPLFGSRLCYTPPAPS